ncbi:hypothetical protein FRC03_007645 [Tulasnella sp. 419]|nr:hypothetical protein FRC03_007645 [Tulasnella sp. 419]
MTYKYGAGLVLLAVATVVGSSVTRSPLHLEAPIQKAPSQKDGRIESSEVVVDPSTSIPFPKTIKFTSPDATPTLTLLGLGVRTVSFLKLQVYAVGFYADLDGVNLSELSTPEEKIDHLIKTRTVAVRLVPTRNTSFQHLRDAYVRSLQNRLMLSKKREGALSEAEEEAIYPFIQQLKAAFPTTTLQKHTPIYLIVSAPSTGAQRRLSIPTLNGKIDYTWVGVELMRGYFEGEGPSPKMKKSVMEGVSNLTQ